MVDYNILANLNTKQAKDFFTPLSDVLRICGPKVVIRFLQDKKIILKVTNESKNIYQFINYKDSLNSLFTISADHRLGIYDLSEFVNLSKIFESDIQLRYNQAERKIELASANDEHNLSYYICDETVVPKTPEALDFTKLSWFNNFKWSEDKFETLSNAMRSLKYPNIILAGKKDELSITVSITESDIKTTSFKSKISTTTPNTSNFNITLEKCHVINILTSSVKEYDISICDKLVRFKGASDICDVDYVLLPLRK